METALIIRYVALSIQVVSYVVISYFLCFMNVQDTKSESGPLSFILEATLDLCTLKELSVTLFIAHIAPVGSPQAKRAIRKMSFPVSCGYLFLISARIPGYRFSQMA